VRRSDGKATAGYPRGHSGLASAKIAVKMKCDIAPAKIINSVDAPENTTVLDVLLEAGLLDVRFELWASVVKPPRGFLCGNVAGTVNMENSRWVVHTPESAGDKWLKEVETQGKGMDVRWQAPTGDAH